MAQIDVAPAKGLFGFLTYNKLPRLLYAGMTGFAPPLDVERWTLHGHMLIPHFELVEAQDALARRDGEWVGRILAQVYQPEFTPVGASRFQFGSLDAVDDIEVVRALTGAAEDWLKARAPIASAVRSRRRERRMRHARAGFEVDPVFLTPWHPPYLSRHVEALGYVKARDLLSYRSICRRRVEPARPHLEPARVERPAENPPDRLFPHETGRDAVDVGPF